jgi:membrane-bound lytic murein transglycosylase B
MVRTPSLRRLLALGILGLTACGGRDPHSIAKDPVGASAESEPDSLQGAATPDSANREAALPDTGAATTASSTADTAVAVGVSANETTAPPVPNGNTPAFDAWVTALRREAEGRGIGAATLDAALHDVQPIPQVLDLDRKQPEFSMTFDDYFAKVSSTERIVEGRRLLALHRTRLDSVQARTGVPAEIIVALWGIESNFGTKLGTFQVVPALATLAYDGRRSQFFRGELFNALRIIDEGHIEADRMIGSWAGAMGQCQFMPSSFVNFAVDEDGDGRADIWTSVADVFGSAANYLAKSGWKREQGWGYEVKLPTNFDASLLGTGGRRATSEWQRLGVRTPAGTDLLADSDTPSSIIRPDEKGRRVFLVTENFEVIMRWNRSTFFATTAGLLSDRIAGR